MQYQLPVIQFKCFLYALVQGGQTALMAASMEGHLQVVEVLLKAEAKPDMQTKVLIFISTQ